MRCARTRRAAQVVVLDAQFLGDQLGQNKKKAGREARGRRCPRKEEPAPGCGWLGARGRPGFWARLEVTIRELTLIIVAGRLPSWGALGGNERPTEADGRAYIVIGEI